MNCDASVVWRGLSSGAVCRILVSKSGIQSMTPTVEVWNPDQRTARKFFVVIFLKSSFSPPIHTEICIDETSYLGFTLKSGVREKKSLAMTDNY